MEVSAKITKTDKEQKYEKENFMNGSNEVKTKGAKLEDDNYD